MMTHFPFSAQGLFFLSGAWISGSFFSFSSTYSRILQKKNNNLQDQIVQQLMNEIKLQGISLRYFRSLSNCTWSLDW
jgi:hypothetical protein